MTRRRYRYGPAFSQAYVDYLTADLRKDAIMSRQNTIYLVYRYRGNAANQSMTPVAVVGYEEASTREQAEVQMARRVEVYNNQYLYAVPASRAPKVDYIAAEELEALRYVYVHGRRASGRE